ncbi:tol-pal system-associated acyl-CoA thioesterase [Oceanobacter mangrovi]|uniref:tol-pal system-associated acyl-CoA thioesterase n=1 Tax=Oceanobacter mangrovi TaxID=2862510 RepID=UPI001C8D9AD8|nr:tol-pal system-associated acyl-CoA thioesterase [Oceanobacter mangrovi]
MTEFEWPVRIYIEDTDAGGIVYYANYLRYTERARTEWLRAMGISQEVLREQGVLFVVTAVDAKYRKPARLDDALTVTLRIETIGKARLGISHQVVRHNVTGETELLVQAGVTIACMSTAGKPLAIPGNILEIIQS